MAEPRRSSKLPPLTYGEMRAMWRNGDTVAEIAAKARKRNGLPKETVREILFGPETADG